MAASGCQSICFVWFLYLLPLTSLQDLPFPGSFINPSIKAVQHLWDGQTKREIREFDDVRKPSYIISTPEHGLYISSFLTDEVLYVQNSRDASSPITTFAKGNGLDGPWGIAVDNHFLYVASFTTDEIKKYDKQTGKYLFSFGNEIELDCPEGIAIGPNNTLYVASFLNDKIVKYDLDGNCLGVVADASSGIKGPEDVAFLHNETLLVSSHYTDSILMFNPSSGMFLGVFAKVDKPVGIIIGIDGNVYVTSYTSNSVVRFNGKTGKFIDVFASNNGLRGPSSVTFADSRSLYCASYDNDKIILFNTTSGISLTLPRKSTQLRL